MKQQLREEASAVQALVIDDSRAVRMLVGNILRDRGFLVFNAGHGQEGLQQLQDNPDISIVFVDWNMPVMDGLAFIQAVRNEPRWNALRIVMVTTETESEQVQRAMQAGANEYVMKPFTPEVLIAKLSLLGAFED